MMIHKMLPALLSLLTFTLAAPLNLTGPLPPIATSFSAIVAFGDSFCDNGTGARNWSGGFWPPASFYEGRFSNGPVWPELVAANLSVPLYDYAIGGATSSSELVQGNTWNGSLIPVPGTYEQITSFLASPPAIDFDTTLFIVTGGASDVLTDFEVTAAASAAVLENGVRDLLDAGATNYLFINYYDLSLIPLDEYLPFYNKSKLRTFSDEFSSALDELATAVEGYYVDLVPIFYDFYYYGQPTLYGFDKYGAYGSCAVGIHGETENVTICDDPEDRVFWDAYHASAKSHQWIAKAVLEELAQ